MAKAQRWKMMKCTAFSPQSFHSLRKTGDTEDLPCQLPWLPSVSLWGCNFKLPASKRWWWATYLCPQCYLREHLAHGSCQMHVLENEWWRENKDTFRDREPEPSNQSRHSPPAGDDEYRGPVTQCNAVHPLELPVLLCSLAESQWFFPPSLFHTIPCGKSQGKWRLTQHLSLKIKISYMSSLFAVHPKRIFCLL